jgi:hypothetical protein
MRTPADTLHPNFYEKALFVKGRRGGTLVVERNVPFHPSRYASIRTSVSLFLGGSCSMGSVFFGLYQGAAIFASVSLRWGWTKFAWRSRLMLDPKRVRASSAVTVRHFGVAWPES